MHVHLTGGRGPPGGAEGEGGAEHLPAQAADDACARHRHGDDGAVCVQGGHLLGGGQQGEHVLLALGHHGDLGEVGAQVLHLAQSVHQIGLVGGSREVVAGGHHLHPGCMGDINGGADDFIAHQGFHVHQVHIPGLNSLEVQQGIRLRLNGFLTTLLCGAEGKQQGNLAQGLPQTLKHVQHLEAVEHALKPVRTPFRHVCGDGVKGLGLGDDLLFGLANNGYTNFGDSSPNLNISHTNGIHRNTPYLYLKIILCIEYLFCCPDARETSLEYQKFIHLPPQALEVNYG